LETLVYDLKRSYDLCDLAMAKAYEDGGELHRYATEQLIARVTEFKAAYFNAYAGKSVRSLA
jgi:hypothetical protein